MLVVVLAGEVVLVRDTKRRICHNYTLLEAVVSEELHRNRADAEFFLMVGAQRINDLIGEARASTRLSDDDDRRLRALSNGLHERLEEHRDSAVAGTAWCDMQYRELASAANEVAALLEPYYMDTDSPELDAPLNVLRALPAVFERRQRLEQDIRRGEREIVEEHLNKLTPPR